MFVSADGRQQFREAIGGQHVEAQDSPLLHFGLGQSASVSRLEVQWSNGPATTVLTNVPADRIIDIVQGQASQAADQLGLLFHRDDGTPIFDRATADALAGDPLGADPILLLDATIALDGGEQPGPAIGAGIESDDRLGSDDDTAIDPGNSGDAPIAVADWLVG